MYWMDDTVAPFEEFLNFSITQENFPSPDEIELVEEIVQMAEPGKTYGEKSLSEILELGDVYISSTTPHPSGEGVYGEASITRDYGYKTVEAIVEFTYFPPGYDEKGNLTYEATLGLSISSIATSFNKQALEEVIGKAVEKAEAQVLTNEYATYHAVVIKNGARNSMAVYDVFHHFSKDRWENICYVTYDGHTLEVKWDPKAREVTIIFEDFTNEDEVPPLLPIFVEILENLVANL